MHKKRILVGALALIMGGLSAAYLYSYCPPDEGSGLCPIERGDRRCNDPGECCPGRTCNSFGYCERAR